MSFDLVETEKNLSHLRLVQRPEVGAWDNFLSGTARFTMQGFAKAGRAVDLAGAVGPIVQDKFTGGTEAQDRFFREHDEVFGSAVDHWTPKPGEVGAAAEIAGTLLSTLPLVMASPALAVGVTQLSVGEDLVRRGVDAGKAQAVGAAQAAGLGLGIWVPILGRTGFERMVVGGAGFNVAQGVVTRGVSGSILEGTAAAEDFQAFDWTALTLDALLGLAFGGMAHLSPAQRKAGEGGWKRIHEWISGARPSDIDALVTLRQAQHLNSDSAGGALADPAAIEAHVQRMRKAIDQLASDKPVDVSDLPAPRVEADAARAKDAERTVAAMQKDAERIAKEHGIVTEQPAPRAPEPEPAPAKPDAQPKAKPDAPAAEKAADPLATEAARFAAAHPDLEITVGRNADGTPARVKAKDLLAKADEALKNTEADAKLFEVAAACMLGVS